MDSDLEAFSHNPTDDSIATLAAQLIAFTMYQLSIQAASFWALSPLCTRSQVAACCLQLEKAKEAPDSQCLCAMVSLVELFGRQDQPSVMDCRANQVALVCVALKPFFWALHRRAVTAGRINQVALVAGSTGWDTTPKRSPPKP